MDSVAFLHRLKPVSGYQFATFRILFGAYLVCHFGALIPYGPELFSNAGVVADPRLNFTYGVFPNPLDRWDSPAAVTAFLLVQVGLAAAFTAGVFRRATAVLLWFGWACLFNRDNLISNPSIPYVGLLLLLSALVPTTEPLRLRGRAGAWYFPAAVFWTAWVVMAVGYTFSGVVKLASPSWVDGSAMLHLVNNPLARPGVIRDVFLASPRWAQATLTWGALAAEVLFLPLSLHRRTRPVAWVTMLFLQCGILAMVDFADLTLGMVLLHLFTFDPEWMPARRGRPGLVLYDGVCGLCDRVVQVLLDEDRSGVLSFAPLQGETARSLVAAPEARGPDFTSIVLVEGFTTPDAAILTRSQAVLSILDTVGGFWRVVSWLRVVPRSVRDAVYDWAARHRYAWFGQAAECRLPPAEVKSRFLP